MLDPLFFIFLCALVGFVIIKKDRLAELFSTGIKPGRDVFDSDYLYIIILTMLSYYPISVILSCIFSTQLIEFSFLGLYIYFILPTLIAGIIYTVVYAPVWFGTVENNGVVAVFGMFIAVMFGAFFSTYLATGLNPNTEVIREVYGYYVDVALDILTLVSTMAVLPVIQRFIEYAYTIFKNNLFVALRGATFAAIGGLFGVGTLMALIPLFTSATVAGLFGGLLLRNNIENAISSFVALLAVLGVPPFWHTFYEFAAFGLIAGSVGMVVYSIVSKQEKRFKFSASGIVVGSLVLLFGAFNEVTVSSSFASIFRSVLDFSPVISDITVDSNYVIVFILSWVAVLFAAVIVTYFTELIVKFTEEVSV